MVVEEALNMHLLIKHTGFCVSPQTFITSSSHLAAYISLLANLLGNSCVMKYVLLQKAVAQICDDWYYSINFYFVIEICHLIDQRIWRTCLASRRRLK